MRAITTPLHELNEYEQINKYLEKPFACAEVTGCVDSQKLHFIDSLGADFKYRIIVTYSDLRAKEIYEDYKFYDRNVTVYPAKDLIFYQADVHSNEIVRQRIRTMRRLLEGRPVTVVTTFSALMAPQIKPEIIRENILDDRPGPLFIQAWGGSSSIAAALRSIEDEYKGSDGWDDMVKKVEGKVILCLSGDQDNAYNSYIAVNWPGVWVWNTNAQMGRYTGNPSLTDPEWTARYMTVGPIGARVRLWGDGKQMVPGDKTDFIGPSAGRTADEMRAEGYYVWTAIQPQGTLYGDGDSGCFYMLIDNGLRAWQDPTWGGWSGRWDITRGAPESGHPSYMGTNIATMNTSTTAVRQTAPRSNFMQEDHTFPNMAPERNLSEAARMKWSVTPDFADANHYPVLDGPFEINAAPGKTVKIKARASDPDGDILQLRWWYFPVGSYVLTNPEILSVDSPETAETTFTVPSDAKSGDTIHFVLQAVDDGDPVLTRYLRTVITVK